MPLNLVAGAIGAVAGAVVCGAGAAAARLLRGQPVDWKTVGSAALGGAVAGGAAGLTLGASLAVSGTALVAGGAAGGAVERTADNLSHDRAWHDGVAKHAAVGGAIGLGGAAARPALTALRPVASSAAGSVARSSVGRAASRGWRAYGRALQRHPLLTKSVTSGAVTAGGDAVAQAIEGQGWDAKRTAFAGGFGLLWVGPSGHAWYGLLGRLVPGTGWRVVGKRLLLDQLVMTPIGGGVYLGAVGAFQGDSPREVADRVRGGLWPLMKDGYVVWPAANLVNFAFVPTRYQVLFGNGVGLGWNTWLSLTNMKKKDRPASADDAGLPGGPVLPSARVATAAVAPAATPAPAPPEERRPAHGIAEVLGR